MSRWIPGGTFRHATGVAVCVKTKPSRSVGRRIGIIGGSFDPIHHGHLIIAQDACEQFALDKILFMPAYQAPLKSKQSEATPQQRLEMTQLAISTDERFAVSDTDFAEGGTSYSVQSATEIQKQYPDDQLYWILGSDQIAQLHRWKDIESLAKMVDFVAFERPGSTRTNVNLPSEIKIDFADSRPLEISSTEIRDRIKRGIGAKYFLPDPVLDYIKAHNLYQAHSPITA